MSDGLTDNRSQPDAGHYIGLDRADVSKVEMANEFLDLLIESAEEVMRDLRKLRGRPNLENEMMEMLGVLKELRRAKRAIRALGEDPTTRYATDYLNDR